MDAERLIDRMKRDHARVLSEVSALESALGTGAAAPSGVIREVRGLLDLLHAQFQTHMLAEDQILFPALVRALPASAGSVEPLQDEHAELRLMLERLRATLAEPPGDSRDEETAVQVHDLADLLRIHIRKEESLVFGIAARLLSGDVIEAVLTRMTAGGRPERTPQPKPIQTKGSLR